MSLKTRQTLAEQIAQYIGQRIIVGELQAGERVKELELAKQLDVSTNTVREAMLLLEKRHLLEIIPRRGAMVAALTQDQVRSLYRLLILLMGEVISNTVKIWQADDLKPFIEKVSLLHQRVQEDDISGFHHHAIEFVENSFQFANNCYMESQLRDLLPVLRRCAYLALISESEEITRSNQFFQNVVNNVVQRDEQKAVEALEQYLEHQCQLVLSAQEKESHNAASEKNIAAASISVKSPLETSNANN